MSFSDHTGHRYIDSVIQTLIKSIGFEHYRTAEGADGQCYRAAERAANFFKEAGIEAWVPVAVQKRDSMAYWDLTPELFGYTERPLKGWPTHYWLCVQSGDEIWGIDFTAAQFGYTDLFPMIQRADSKSVWAKRRVPRKHLPTPLEIAQRRIDADPDHPAWAGQHARLLARAS